MVLVGKLGDLLGRSISVSLVSKSWIPTMDYFVSQNAGEENVEQFINEQSNAKAYFRDCIQVSIDDNAHLLVLKTLKKVDPNARFDLANFEEIDLKQGLQDFCDKKHFTPLGVNVVDTEADEPTLIKTNRAETIGVRFTPKKAEAFRLFTQRDVAMLQMLLEVKEKLALDIDLSFFGTVFNGQPMLRLLDHRPDVAGHLLQRLEKTIEANTGYEEG